MAYRLDTAKPPKPEDHLLRFSVRNGATMRMTFGCYYAGKGHDPNFHDYINWPSHDYHPGAICQMNPPRQKIRWTDGHLPNSPVHLDPIHLIEEGYTEAKVVFDDDEVSASFDAEASIDPETDNYVRIKLHANHAFFEDKPLETRFTVFVSKPDEEAVDAVCHGIVTILPGSPYPVA